MRSAKTLLIKGGCVATVDDADTVVPDGYVLVRGNTIAEVGPAAAAPPEADEIIDASGCIVIPGMINSHEHLWYNLTKCLSDGMLLEPRGKALSLPVTHALSLGDLEASAYLAGLEMVASGTTTFFNHSVTDTTEAEMGAQIRPTAKVGLRQVFGKELRPYPTVTESLDFAASMHSQWSGYAGGRVGIGLVIESTAHWVAIGTSSEQLIVRGNELADRLGAKISAHMAGGTMARDFGYLKYVVQTGRTEVEYLHRLGVLDEKWMLVHMINTTPRDIELVARAGAAVSHTPTAEATRGGGITPVRQMLAAGVTVSLGTDGPNVDTSMDMVEQMKSTLMLQSHLAAEPVIGGLRSLRMATMDSAKAIGIDHRVGSLEAGKLADIGIFNLDTPSTAGYLDPVTMFAYGVRGRDVRTLLIDGEIVVRDGVVQTLDEDEVGQILAEATGRARALIERAGVRSARWATTRQQEAS